MIDLNKIRSLKTLEEMKSDLTQFLAFDRAVMVEVYNDQEWSEDDYEADKEEVAELLEHVERRIKSLGNHVVRKQKVRGSEGNVRRDVRQSGGAESSPSSQFV